MIFFQQYYIRFLLIFFEFPGQKFAILELKTIISSILRHFTLEPIDSAEDITLMVDLVLRMKGPLHVKFNPRS